MKRRLEQGEQDLSQLEHDLRRPIEETPGVVIDYAVIVDAETLLPPVAAHSPLVALVAVRVGTTRLIDNMILRPMHGRH